MNTHSYKSLNSQPDLIDYMLSHADTIPLLDRSYSDTSLDDSLLHDQGIEVSEDLMVTEDELYCMQVEHQEAFFTRH